MYLLVYDLLYACSIDTNNFPLSLRPLYFVSFHRQLQCHCFPPLTPPSNVQRGLLCLQPQEESALAKQPAKVTSGVASVPWRCLLLRVFRSLVVCRRRQVKLCSRSLFLFYCLASFSMNSDATTYNVTAFIANILK